jgi:hypothetical protein
MIFFALTSLIYHLAILLQLILMLRKKDVMVVGRPEGHGGVCPCPQIPNAAYGPRRDPVLRSKFNCEIVSFPAVRATFLGHKDGYGVLLPDFGHAVMRA